MQIRNHSYLFSNISSLKSSPLGGYLLTLTNGNNTLKKKIIAFIQHHIFLLKTDKLPNKLL